MDLWLPSANNIFWKYFEVEKMESKNTIGYISFVDFQYSYQSKNILKVGNIGN